MSYPGAFRVFNVSDSYIAVFAGNSPDNAKCDYKIFLLSVSAAENWISWFFSLQVEWTMKAQTSSCRSWWCSFNGKAIGEKRHDSLSVTCLKNAGGATTTTITKRDQHRRRWERWDSSFLPGFAYRFTYLSFLLKFSDDVCSVSIMLTRNIEQEDRGNTKIKYERLGIWLEMRIDNRISRLKL